MFNPIELLIDSTIAHLQVSYRQVFGTLNPDHATLIGKIAATTLSAIAHTDALYHDIEHTVLVTLVGTSILHGKHRLDGDVSPQDWLNFIAALLCHDIGYLKGICRQDHRAENRYTTGNGMVTMRPGATDASLTPYHVDRSQQFVAENLTDFPLLDISTIQQLIEFTRFPVPDLAAYQETTQLPGLARAADLIGQLGDVRYLEKLPALFQEFTEVGIDKTLGYRHSGDLRLGYPHFFHLIAHPLIQPALRYLQETSEGQQVIAQLYENLTRVEQELTQVAASDRPAISFRCDHDPESSNALDRSPVRLLLASS